MRMIAEAVVLAIEEDLAADLDPNERNPAPAELWELFWKTQQIGTRIVPADVDTPPGSGDTVIATVMYLMPELGAVEDGYRTYPVPAHNGERTEISDQYIRGLCRNFGLNVDDRKL